MRRLNYELQTFAELIFCKFIVYVMNNRAGSAVI